MKHSSNSIEKQFFIDYYDMHLYRYYIEKYRNRALHIKQTIDRLTACAPLFFLTLVMICDEKRSIWIAFASISSVVEVFCRYLPYQAQIDELQNCARKMDALISKAKRCWDKYRLGLIQVSEFQIEYEQCYKVFTKIHSTVTTEAYNDNPKFRDYALKKADQRLREITDYEIGKLLNEIKRGGADSNEE